MRHGQRFAPDEHHAFEIAFHLGAISGRGCEKSSKSAAENHQHLARDVGRRFVAAVGGVAASSGIVLLALGFCVKSLGQAARELQS